MKMQTEFDWKSEFVLEIIPQTQTPETEPGWEEFEIGATETRPVYFYMF